MVSQRWARSSRNVTDTRHGDTKTRRRSCTSSTPCLRASVARFTNDPALRIVMFEILAPRDPPENHRLGDPPFVRSYREGDVRYPEAAQPPARHAVRHVHESPGRIRQQIRIARK